MNEEDFDPVPLAIAVIFVCLSLLFAPMLDEDGDGKREVSWHWPHYRELAKYIKRAAEELGIEVEWGGDWKRFPDGPHWQL